MPDNCRQFAAAADNQPKVQPLLPLSQQTATIKSCIQRPLFRKLISFEFAGNLDIFEA